jgi:cysteine desulfurase
MIYLDNNATTRPLPEVICSVHKAMNELFGNPSSMHPLGADARRTLEASRETVANGLGATSSSQIVFTSCGTESINTAFSLLIDERISQIAISSVEHAAVIQAASRWARGRSILQIPVSRDGLLDVDALVSFIQKAPSLVSVSCANNETGVLTNIPAFAEICHRHGALLHVDAVQAAGKTPLSLSDLCCDAASLSAHKFHGPPGCGILYLRTPNLRNFGGQPILPGHQEFGFRAGTHNLPAIIGTAIAVESLRDGASAYVATGQLRDRLENRLLSLIPGSQIHGVTVSRLPNTTSIYCPGRNAADLVTRLGQLGLAVSAGAACSKGGEPSHVIQAMGFSPERANSTIRISLSRFTTVEEVDESVLLLKRAFLSTLPSTQ